jgi:hypothetical protein
VAEHDGTAAEPATSSPAPRVRPATIVGDLGGLNHLSWVVTAYLLASTVASPLSAKPATSTDASASSSL